MKRDACAILLFFALISLCRGELPEPYDQLGLDSKQEMQVTTILNKYTCADLKNDALKKKFINELDTVLNEKQRKQFNELCDQMVHGVDIGMGLVRSYEFKPYFVPHELTTTDDPSVRGPEFQEDLLRQQDGIKFTVSNKSGHPSRKSALFIQCFSADGKCIAIKLQPLAELADGKSQDIIVIFNNVALIRSISVKATPD